MNTDIIEEKPDKLDSEMADIINIAEFLYRLCDCEYIDEYMYKLYLLKDLLKPKCIKIDEMHYDLKQEIKKL